MPVLIICVLLTIGYMSLMGAYRFGWQKQKDFTLPPQFVPATFISVIVPARNERKNIGACLESLLAQKYPLGQFEIIVVDDHSDDDTAGAVNEHAAENVRCISLADHMDPGAKITSFKKAALAAGISQSTGTLIVTIDADCVAPNSWLMHLAAIYEKQNPVMIVAPVIYSADHNLLHIFQLIDFMSMQGITAAAQSLKLGNMCNGANLAFSKAAFEIVKGYEGSEHIATGDDYHLMVKMSQLSPNGITYLKTPKAIVTTTPQPDVNSFLQQRIRWASKSGKYKDTRLTAILLFVYIYNLSFLVLMIANFFHPVYFYVALGMLAVKIIAEYLFLEPVARFFNDRWVLGYFPLLQPLHILYIIAAGFLGFIGSYNWKGRKIGRA